MAENKDNNGIFWALLLLIGGGAVWAINKFIVSPTKDNSGGGSSGSFGIDHIIKDVNDVHSDIIKEDIATGKGTLSNSSPDLSISISGFNLPSKKSDWHYQLKLKIQNKSSKDLYLYDSDLEAYFMPQHDWAATINLGELLLKAGSNQEIAFNMLDAYLDGTTVKNKLSQVWNKDYKLWIYGNLTYAYSSVRKKPTNRLLLDFNLNHKAESSKPNLSAIVKSDTGLGGGGGGQKSSGHYGIGNYMPKENLNTILYHNIVLKN